jgi:hypothetical protein
MPTGPFLHVSEAELARARERLHQPAWQPAASTLRQSAEASMAHLPARPEFDSSWYDANPGRDYMETYNQFADYAYSATELAQTALKLLLTDALFHETRYTTTALELAHHVIRHFKFHVSHHDAGLNYAHVAVALANVFTHANHYLPHADVTIFRNQLRSCGEALRRSTDHWLKNLARMPYNNHFAHHRLGLLAVALVLENQQWIDEALTGPRNFAELLVGSTTDDGLCYESSTVYHFGTLSGLLQSATLVARQPQLKRDFFHETFANGRTLKDMFDAPLNLLLPTGELPAVGDCYAWRDPIWKMRADVFEQGYAAYKDPRYAWLLQKAGPRTSSAALLYGEDHLEPSQPPTPRTRVWLEHGYALLASHPGTDYWAGHAAFITGDYSGIHHHRDALSIQLALGGKLWLEDVESAAVALQRFAAPIQHNFNRTMLPHNLVIVDQQDQAAIARPLPIVEFKDHPTQPTIGMADPAGLLTPGVLRLRHVALTPDYCLDLYQVASDDSHTYDYVIHPRTDAPVKATAPALMPISLPHHPPYATLRNCEAAPVPEAGVMLHWSQSGETVRCDLSTAGKSELIRAEWPTKSDHTGPWREMFMLRVQADSTHFLAIYQLSAGGAAPWKITSAERYFNGHTHEFRISASNGAGTRNHVFSAL